MAKSAKSAQVGTSAGTENPRAVLKFKLNPKMIDFTFVTFQCFFDDFDFRAPLGPILKGRSDQN